jgi:ribosomal protein S15P/S13E
MGKKTTDKRPSRGQQKERTKTNKLKQLEKHLEKYPKDQIAQKKLERVKSGKVRAHQ